MKVKELIAKLNAADPESDVLCCCEDEGTLARGVGFKLFDIDHIDSTEAEKTRLEDGTPYFKLGKSDNSESHVLIDITADF